MRRTGLGVTPKLGLHDRYGGFALVTGAARGLGRAIALALADAGVAAQKNHGTGHKATTEYPVKLTKTGAMPRLNVIGQLGELVDIAHRDRLFADTAPADTEPVNTGPATAADPAKVFIVGDSDAGTFGPYLERLLDATNIVDTELDDRSRCYWRSRVIDENGIDSHWMPVASFFVKEEAAILPTTVEVVLSTDQGRMLDGIRIYAFTASGAYTGEYATTDSDGRAVFDMAALKSLLRDIQSRAIQVDDVETRSASPFARSLVFAYVAKVRKHVEGR